MAVISLGVSAGWLSAWAGQCHWWGHYHHHHHHKHHHHKHNHKHHHHHHHHIIRMPVNMCVRLMSALGVKQGKCLNPNSSSPMIFKKLCDKICHIISYHHHHCHDIELMLKIMNPIHMQMMHRSVRHEVTVLAAPVSSYMQCKSNVT